VSMRGLVTTCVIAGALLAATTATARGEDPNSAKAHFVRGTKLYDLGRYLEAAKEYEATYEIKDDPALLFNIGQAYRLGKQYPDAIRAYKSFLRRAPESQQRGQIEGYLKTMQDEVDRQEAAKTPTVAPTVAPTPTPTPTPMAAPAPAQTERPIYKKWWLWTIVGGVVVAGVVVGVTVGVLASRDSFNPSLGKVGPAALEVRF
jgi:hypothetical protein